MQQFTGNAAVVWLQLALPERGEDAVSDKDAEAVHQRQLQTDVLEMIVSASQQVPGHQLLRAEPLGHLDLKMNEWWI